MALTMPTLLLLAMTTLLAWPWPPLAAAQYLQFSNQTYVVCVSAWAPFVFHNETTGAVTGYEIDLATEVFRRLGMASVDWRHMLWGDMIAGLTLPVSDSARCDIAPSSIPVTVEAVLAGSVFSVPTFRSGYAVLVPVTGDSYDIWSFLKVFSPELWAAVFLTGMLLAVLIFISERDMMVRGVGKSKYPREVRRGLIEANYRIFGKLFNAIDEPRVASIASQVIALAWGMLVLVTISTYTAGLTALLTSRQYSTQISSVADLPQFRVATWDAIIKSFLRYGFVPEGLPWDTEEDGLRMLDRAANREFDALVLDEPWLRYYTNTRCDLKIVGRTFQPVNNAVGFNVNLPDAFVAEYNKVLVALLEEGFYETLESAYIKESVCGKQSTSAAIKFEQLAGLWVIVAAMVAFALLLLVIPRVIPKLDVDLNLQRSLSSFSRSFSMATGKVFPGGEVDAGSKDAASRPPRKVEDVEDVIPDDDGIVTWASRDGGAEAQKKERRAEAPLHEFAI
eukprot:365356-Chlamydomonas_euryale.AAC.4